MRAKKNARVRRVGTPTAMCDNCCNEFPISALVRCRCGELLCQACAVKVPA